MRAALLVALAVTPAGVAAVPEADSVALLKQTEVC